MTFEQFLHDELFNSGLFEQDVQEVLRRVKAAPENKVMEQRWNDDMSGYPIQMKSVALFTARRHALEWIDETCPQAWFRAIFVDAKPEEPQS